MVIPKGKGTWIWQIRRCENGDPQAIADEIKRCGYGHVIIKVSDGVYRYNIQNKVYDRVPAVIKAIRETTPDVQIFGYHFVYGRFPRLEADQAIRRIRKLDIDGWVINAEGHYKLRKAGTATIYLSKIRAAHPDMTLMLSSYRYPKAHPEFPWKEFLSVVSINMPQVYWIKAHNPAEQLRRSLSEFQSLGYKNVFIPTGAAFCEWGWCATMEEVLEFTAKVERLELPAVNYWEWGATREKLPAIWEFICLLVWNKDDDEDDPYPIAPVKIWRKEITEWARSKGYEGSNPAS